MKRYLLTYMVFCFFIHNPLIFCRLCITSCKSFFFFFFFFFGGGGWGGGVGGGAGGGGGGRKISLS